jgi:hypothetical protein
MAHKRATPAELYGVAVNEIARLCQVDVTTARRWKRGTRCPPKSALLLIAGDLGVFGPRWRGWIVRGDQLISPEGWEIPVNQLRAFPVILNELAGYQTEFRRMRADVLIAQPPRLIEQQQPPTPSGVASISFKETLIEAAMPSPSPVVRASVAPPEIKKQARTGRPPRLGHADEWDLYSHRMAGLSIKRCAAAFGISVPTANRIIAKVWGGRVDSSA